MTEYQRDIGYRTVVDRLQRVQHLLGRQRAFDILAQHGVKSVRDLHPRKYPSVIYHAEYVCASTHAWEKIVDVRVVLANLRRPKGSVTSAPHFVEAVDDWLAMCDQELRLMSPELYNDRGDPLD